MPIIRKERETQKTTKTTTTTTNTKTEKRARGNRSYSEMVRAKWLSCAFKCM